MSSGAISDREQKILGIIETARGKRAKFRDAHITMAHGAGGKATQSLIEGMFVPALRPRDGARRAGRRRELRGRGPRAGAHHRLLRGQAAALPGRVDRRAGGERNRQRPGGRGRSPARPVTVADPRGGSGRRPPARRGGGDRARRRARRRGDHRRGHQGGRTRPRRRDVCVHRRGRASGRPRARWRRAGSGRATGCCCPGRSAITAPRSCWPGASSSSMPRSSRTPARCGPPSTRCWRPPARSVRCLRDATRGGVASVLNELARASAVSMLVREGSSRSTRQSPARRRSSASTRCTWPTRASWWRSWRRRRPTAALAALRAVPGCEQAAEIGEVRTEPPGMVLVQTSFGGRRVMDQLVGDPLPRIC